MLNKHMPLSNPRYNIIKMVLVLAGWLTLNHVQRVYTNAFTYIEIFFVDMFQAQLISVMRATAYTKHIVQFFSNISFQNQDLHFT